MHINIRLNRTLLIMSAYTVLHSIPHEMHLNDICKQITLGSVAHETLSLAPRFVGIVEVTLGSCGNYVGALIVDHVNSWTHLVTRNWAQ